MSFMSERCKALINISGQDITFVQRTSATYNKTTGANDSIFENLTVKGSVRNYTPHDLAGGLVKQIDREVIIATDAMRSIMLWATDNDTNITTESGGNIIFTSAAIDVLPKEQDLVIIDNKTYQIVTAEVVNGKNADLVYILQVRGNAN